MRKLLLLLPVFLGSAFSPALASIYVDLETRKVVATKDGDPLVEISDGMSSVKTSNPRDKNPAGTNHLKNGQSITSPLNPDEFSFYSKLFYNLKSNPLWKPLSFGDPESYICLSKSSNKKLQCIAATQKQNCNSISSQYIKTKDYPVDGERRVMQWLRYLKPGFTNIEQFSCEESNLQLGCRAGRCWGYPSSGEYGFYPGKWNTISIDGRKWGFADDLSRQQELEIWEAIKDGSRFAYQLVHWPNDSIVTGTQTISLPKGLKDTLYRRSLEKP